MLGTLRDLCAFAWNNSSKGWKHFFQPLEKKRGRLARYCRIHRHPVTGNIFGRHEVRLTRSGGNEMAIIDSRTEDEVELGWKNDSNALKCNENIICLLANNDQREWFTGNH